MRILTIVHDVLFFNLLSKRQPTVQKERTCCRKSVGHQIQCCIGHFSRCCRSLNDLMGCAKFFEESFSVHFIHTECCIYLSIYNFACANFSALRLMIITSAPSPYVSITILSVLFESIRKKYGIGCFFTSFHQEDTLLIPQSHFVNLASSSTIRMYSQYLTD